MNSVFCLETREKIGQDMGFGEARQGGSSARRFLPAFEFLPVFVAKSFRKKRYIRTFVLHTDCGW